MHWKTKVNKNDIKIRKDQPPVTKVHNSKKEYKRKSRQELWHEWLDDISERDQQFEREDE